MMKQEFEALIGREVTPEEYGEIEYVYNWHPAIPEVAGKNRIAELYKAGGRGLIQAMTDEAAQAEFRYNRLMALKRTVAEAQEEINAIMEVNQRIQQLWKSADSK